MSRNVCSFLILAGFALVAAWGCSQRANTDPVPTGDPAVMASYRSATKGGATEVVASTGTGWGTLKGKFTLAGAIPQLRAISSAGKEHCDKHSITDETLIVDSASKGIKNIVIYARKVGRVHPDLKTDEVAKKEVVFDQEQCVFKSHVLAVQKTQKLLVKNSDPVSHNTSIQPQGDTGINPLLAPNGSLTYQFSKPQNLPVAVSCTIHPWMKSYILPRNDPYFAITNEQGEFTIEKLPAGETIEFQVWHEASTALNPAWSDGRFKITVKDGESQELPPVVVDVSKFNLP